MPPADDAATAARMRTELTARLTDMQTKAGIPLERQAITAGYHFILGLARDPAPLYKNPSELARALSDSASLGDTSRLEREVYASLRGRYFETLECHSNGAMVCLAALRKGDVAARSVRLLGPQISEQSLPDWEWLIEEGYIDRVRLFVMSNDPVPVFSRAYSSLELRQWAAANQTLRNRVLRDAPALDFETLTCPLADPGFMSCHSIRLYQQALAAAR